MTEFLAFFRAHPTLLEVLKLVFATVLAAVALAIVLRLEKKLARRFLEKKNDINLHFVDSIVRFVVILVVVQWVVMSSEITQPFGRVLFQGTAIIGAVAGFAAQPVIADLICGLMISATKPFELGDRIELENGTAGIVKDITLRHVVIQTIDTVRVVVPNSKLNSMNITNMSYHTKVRSIHFRFNVGYDSDVAQAMAVIRSAIEASPLTIPGKPGPDGGQYGPVYFIAFADSSLVLATTVYYTADHPTEVVKSDINLRVKRALEDNGIEIPYNYVHVVMGESER